MSEEQLKAFLEKVKTDASLQEKLKAAADNDAVAAIAKDAGFSISADDLKKAQSEISEEELESVAGSAGNGGCCLNLGFPGGGTGVPTINKIPGFASVVVWCPPD